MALKLRRAEERFIPYSTRAASFKRLLGSVEPTDSCGNEPKALLIHANVLDIDALTGFENPKPWHVGDLHEMTPDVPGSGGIARNSAVALFFAPILHCANRCCHGADWLGRLTRRFTREVIRTFRP